MYQDSLKAYEKCLEMKEDGIQRREGVDNFNKDVILFLNRFIKLGGENSSNYLKDFFQNNM